MTTCSGYEGGSNSGNDATRISDRCKIVLKSYVIPVDQKWMSKAEVERREEEGGRRGKQGRKQRGDREEILPFVMLVAGTRPDDVNIGTGTNISLQYTHKGSRWALATAAGYTA